MRYFGQEGVYKSSIDLASTSGLGRPGGHKDTVSYTNDLVTNMKKLINAKKLTKIVMPASELGRVPLGSLSISDKGYL